MIGAGIMAAVLAASCMIASCTDIRRGKIYNRHLGWAFAVGGVGAVMYYLKCPDCALPFLVNLLGGLVIAGLFYHFKLWGAGDAKFWLLICTLYPYRWYALADYLVVPAVYILFFMFLIAYVYVLIETVYLMFRDKNTSATFETQPSKAGGVTAILPSLCRAFFCFATLKCFYAFFAAFFRQYFWANYLFFALLGLVFSLYISGKNIARCWQAVWALVGILWIIVPSLMDGWSAMSLKVDLTAWIMVLVVIFLRGKMARYNYEEIPTGDVKTGMILSVTTVALFQQSRVKGLPEYTDESTGCRLSREQADAVGRWGNSRYGRGRVVVVKYLPFGIFMSLGTVAYVIWRVVLIG